jgi:hypothetical protein
MLIGMTAREKFERAKANLLETREALTNLDKRPSAERRQQLTETLQRERRAYDAALTELRASGQPLVGVDFLR